MIPSWLKTAQGYFGLKEIKGDADNPRIMEFYKRVGHPEVKHDEVPWCAAFVGGCLAENGIKGSGTLAARDYEHWGQPILSARLEDSPDGTIVVLSRPGGEAWQGHVGFKVGMDESHVILLGGNQGDAVCYAKFDRSRIVALRWPPGIPVEAPTNEAVARDVKDDVTDR